jgi:hypothetical protein
MIWNDLVDLCSDGVIEPIADSSSSFFQKSPLVMYGANIQMTASRYIENLEAYYSFNTVVGQQEYSLPKDFIKSKNCKYSNTHYLIENWKMPEDAANPNGTPIYFYIRSNYIGFYPVPNAVKTIVLWYKRFAPPFAFRVTDTLASTRTSSVAYWNYLNTAFIIHTVGGVGAGTYTYTAANYPTVVQLVAAINAATATNKCVATQGNQIADAHTINGTLGYASLQITEDAPMNLMTGTKTFYTEPELPEEEHIPILYNAMMARLKMNDRELKVAQVYDATYRDALAQSKIHWKERTRGSANPKIGDVYDTYIVPRGANGWVTLT